MKYRITYTREEAREADDDLAVLRARHPGAKIRRGENGERKILYLTTPPKRARPTEKSCGEQAEMV